MASQRSSFHTMAHNIPRKNLAPLHSNGNSSSPHYPKSNGKAESAVKTCKNLLKKADLAKIDVYLSLLDHRNTSTEQTGLSPAQRSVGRRTRTLLPLASKLLEPVTSTNVRTKLISSRAKQASYYNRSAKPLQDLQAGDVVRLMSYQVRTTGPKVSVRIKQHPDPV